MQIKSKVCDICDSLPSKRSFDFIIIGAGISGISTAYMLQKLGYRSMLVSEVFPHLDSWTMSSALVPSWYAMASAYPHFLEINNLETIMQETQNIFMHFINLKTKGLYMYKMHEVFEEGIDTLLPLSELRSDFKKDESCRIFLNRDENFDSMIPPINNSVFSFNTVFVDMPLYMSFLYSEYSSLGGVLCRKKFVSLNELEHLETGTIINCMGFSGAGLFLDKSNVRIVRGRLVTAVPSKTLPDELYTSAYNYYPLNRYLRTDGSPEYLHYFPRNDGILLGQTREVGQIESDSLSWHGIQVEDEEFELDGIKIPKSIISLNEEIVSNWVGEKISFSPKKAMCGYRYYRAPGEGGVRLEEEFLKGKKIIHNYGHGGSGVTVSWGCALEVSKICVDLEHSEILRRFFADTPFAVNQ